MNCKFKLSIIADLLRQLKHIVRHSTQAYLFHQFRNTWLWRGRTFRSTTGFDITFLLHSDKGSSYLACGSAEVSGQ
jgi:hypothetical protein